MRREVVLQRERMEQLTANVMVQIEPMEELNANLVRQREQMQTLSDNLNRLMRITLFALSWACWLDASDRSLSLAEAKTGHLGYLPKGRKVRDEAGLNTSPVAA